MVEYLRFGDKPVGLSEVSHCYLTATGCPDPEEDSLRAVRILRAVYESAQTDRFVSIGRAL